MLSHVSHRCCHHLKMTRECKVAVYYEDVKRFSNRHSFLRMCKAESEYIISVLSLIKQVISTAVEGQSPAVKCTSSLFIYKLIAIIEVLGLRL